MQIGSPYKDGTYIHVSQHTAESVKLHTREKYLAFVFGYLFNQESTNLENLQLVGNQNCGQSAFVKLKNILVLGFVASCQVDQNNT